MTEDGKTPTDAPPEEDPRPDGLKPAQSLLLVNTGDGKGKSSAAFGVAMRARARDWPVAVIQFLKSDDWVTGEQMMAETLGIDFQSLGDGFTWDSDDLSKDEAEAKEAWRQGKELIDSVLIAFDHGFDAAVRPVADPACEDQRPRGFHRPCPVPDALHLAGDGQMARDPGHQCTRLIQVWPPSRSSTMKLGTTRIRSDSRL